MKSLKYGLIANAKKSLDAGCNISTLLRRKYKRQLKID